MSREQTMPQAGEAIAAALGTFPGLVSCYLFGSFAENRAHRDSDVDVGVLLDRRAYASKADRFEARLKLISLLATSLSPRQPDVVVLNDAPSGLAARIVTTGIRTICRDSENDRAFQRDSQLRAADIEPFLRRMRSIKLDAIKARR
jgi:predicted nucleotidyltransferase